MKHIFLFFLAFLIAAPAHAALKLVATYPPLQSLVWSVSQGIEPVSTMFFKPGNGHHNVQIKPSELRALQSADIVFWAGPELESFMPDALQTVAPNALSVPLMKEVAGLKLLPSLSDPKKPDPHFWMDVDNAVLVLNKVAEILSEKDPANAATYAANRDKSANYLKSLKGIEGPGSDKKIVALHDGFEYMTRFFDLNATTLGVDPEHINTPQAMQAFQKKLREEKPACVIIEPNLQRRQIRTLGLDNYPTQKMDAFGWNISLGPGQYFQMMRWNMRALQRCGTR